MALSKRAEFSAQNFTKSESSTFTEWSYSASPPIVVEKLGKFYDWVAFSLDSLNFPLRTQIRATNWVQAFLPKGVSSLTKWIMKTDLMKIKVRLYLATHPQSLSNSTYGKEMRWGQRSYRSRDAETTPSGEFENHQKSTESYWNAVWIHPTMVTVRKKIPHPP